MGIEFNIKESSLINGIWEIKPNVSNDIRGNIWTNFIKSEISQLINDDSDFVHDKFSLSKKNVLRGIHGDKKTWKLVTCVYGEVFQVAVDCRPNSSTYGKYHSFNICHDSPLSVLMSPMIGNAYYVKSKYAVYHYKLAYTGSYIDADQQFSCKWDDPKFNIKWPTNDPLLSQRDKFIVG